MKRDIILLVEDNPDDVELTLRAFHQSKIANKIVVARDGAEAVDYLFAEGVYAGRGADDDPALVLLDLHVAKIDGLEILRRLRANPRIGLTPVVILTTSREQPDVILAYQLGANSYIRKPVDFQQFADAVRQIGLYWLVLNEPTEVAPEASATTA